MVAALSELLGQKRASGLMRRYLETGRVPPGLLFFGEEGIGKETAARAFAAALLCRAPSGEDACGSCHDCRLFRAGSHPNALRVVPENLSISIDDIRRLQEELSLKAFSDRPRVATILPADRMTVQAANALLKTLEEPPPATHLLLVAHRISRLPVTIVSRCQNIPFVPLSTDLVERILASGSGPAAAYLSIANHGEREDRLLGARSSCCSTIEIHQTRLSEGRMSMVPIDEGLAIEPGSSVGLAPGGYHLMLFDLSGPLREGESFTITLQFEVAGDVPVDVRIRR